MEIVKIEIPKHLIKFLSKSYGMNIVATKNNDLGGILIDYLQKDFVKNKFSNKENVYSFYISKQNAAKYGYCISDQKNKELIKRLNSLFNIAMETFVNATTALELQYKRPEHSNLTQSRLSAYQQFLEYHNITDDELRFDSLYRKDLRRRNKKEKANQKPKISIKKVNFKKETLIMVNQLCRTLRVNNYNKMSLEDKLATIQHLVVPEKNTPKKAIVKKQNIGHKKNKSKKTIVQLSLLGGFDSDNMH